MKRLLFALCTSLALLVVSLPAAPPYYPLDQVKAGMVATGYTVWQGDKIEEFKVHILGVLRNVIGPRRDLILARLEGGPLAQTGVIAGMSGSPVYIDGQLVGAVSYSLGSFSKEPIAGITPITEMIDAASLDTPRAPVGTRARLEMPVTRDSVAAAMRASMSWTRPFADRPGDVQVFGDGVNGQVATMLRPIATPLNLGGFSPELAEMLGASFRDYGFLPIAGAAAASAQVSGASDAPLRPGDCGRRQHRQRRFQHGRHRYGDRSDRQPRLCVRPSVLQPGTGRISDDEGLRPHAAAQHDVVDENRDDSATSSARFSRIARRRSPD